MTDETTLEDRDDDLPLHPDVRSMIERVRAEVPVVDWARVEARLFDEHGAVRDHGAPRSVGTLARIVAPLAIAASFAIGLLAPSSARPSGSTTTAARAPLVLDGRVLHVGDTIVAPPGGAVVRSQGRVEVHFVPGSVARLVDDGERIRFSLEKGAMAASVVPVPGGEPFAIDAHGHRVAVHGTKLFVASDASAVVVAVYEGNAVVGVSSGDGRTEGAIVPAGAIGRFDGASALVSRDPSAAERAVLDAMSPTPTVAAATLSPEVVPDVVIVQSSVGQSEAQSDVPSAVTTTAKPVVKQPDVAPPVKTDDPSVVPPPAVTTTATAAIVVPPAAAGLTSTETAGPLAQIVSSLQTCVVRTTTSVHFSITTTMTLSVDPSGSVVDASFDDAPLAPELRACALSKITPVKFPTAAGKSTLSRSVVLGTP